MKKALAISLLALGVAAAAAAQANAASGGQVMEMKYFTVESALVMAYSLPGEEVIGGSSFLLNFAVADNFAFGAQSYTVGGDPAIVLMKLSFYLNELLGFAASFGGNGTNALFGAGAFVTLLKNTSASGLSNAMKLRFEYLFPETGIGDGIISLTAGFSLGL